MRAMVHEQGLLSRAECEAVIALFDEDHGHGAAYGENTDYIRKRTSIVELPEPLFERIQDAVTRANARFWGYAGAYAREHELYRYTPGDFFDWHMDLGEGDAAHRKLTTLIQLSPATDYTGGHLELWGNEPHTAARAPGTLLIYPSYVMHRVTEVTRGVRWSLGGELLGPPFV